MGDSISHTINFKLCLCYTEIVPIITTNLFISFEHIAPEHIAWSFTGDIAEYFEILRVVRDIEYSVLRVSKKQFSPVTT